MQKYKAGIIFFGDIAVFFGSLALTLYIRYGNHGYMRALHDHIGPFSILLILFVGVFYAADLYTYTSWRSTLENGKRFLVAMCVNLFLSVCIFYTFGATFKLTPKLSLAVFTLLFSIFDIVWRYMLARVLAAKKHTRAVIIVSTSTHADMVATHISQHPQLGFTVQKISNVSDLSSAVEAAHKNCLIVIDADILENATLTGIVRELLAEHIEIETLTEFSERILGRVPLSEMTEAWLIEETRRDRSLYEAAKRGLDILLATFGILLLSPVYVVLGIIIPFTTTGPAIYKQERVGQNGKLFTIYKFRNMYHAAEKNPDLKGTAPVWWQKNDPRVTPVGRFLRKSHLDELPQLWNILRGDMSLVGPRPERPQFTEELTTKLPSYMLRTIVRPGLTGWAQLRFQYAGTLEEWSEKLQYDLYYVKHRGFFFDLGILARTVQKFI